MTDGTTESAPSYSPDELQRRGTPARPFSLVDLQERKHSLDSYRGKWVLLNVLGNMVHRLLGRNSRSERVKHEIQR